MIALLEHLVVLSLSLGPLPFVSGYSSGSGTSCNISMRYGCSSWTNGDRLQCSDVNPGIMKWVAQPVLSPAYSVRTGDEEISEDSNKYVPGELLTLYIRTLVYKMNFRGLLLQAFDSSGAFVGSFEPGITLKVPEGCPGSVIHKDADEKPALLITYWRAPSNFNDSVTFRALVKMGPANHGFFYYTSDLTVVAETSLPTSSVRKAAQGVSCSSVCGAAGASKLTCVLFPTEPSSFDKIVRRNIPCSLASVADCSAVVDASNVCHFREAACGEDRSSCTSVDAERLCYCEPRPVTAISSAQLTFKWWSGLPLMASLLSRSHGLFSAVCALALAQTASAHNWVPASSRSPNLASTRWPCLSRKKDEIHYQVGPDQPFAFNWATGHGGVALTVIIKGAYESKLAAANFSAMINDYVASAPSTAFQNDLSDQRYLHVREVAATNEAAFQPGGKYAPSEFLGSRVARNESNFISNSIFPTTTQIALNASYAAQDHRRVSYYSSKYPWLELVLFGSIFTSMPNDYFIVNLAIPNRPTSPAGHYVVHWRWGGYYDCSDVELRTQAVPYPYGFAPTPMTMSWTKIDHCEFTAPRRILTPCMDASVSAIRCAYSLPNIGGIPYSSVNGVGIQVVANVNPSSVFSSWRNISMIPLSNPTCMATTPNRLNERGVVSSSAVSWTDFASQTSVKVGVKCSELKTATLVWAEAVLQCVNNWQCAGLAWPTSAYNGPNTFPIESAAQPYVFCNASANETVNSNWTSAYKLVRDFNPSRPLNSSYADVRIAFGPTFYTTGRAALPPTWLADTALTYRNYSIPSPWQAGTNLSYGFRCGGYNNGVWRVAVPLIDYSWTFIAPGGGAPTDYCNQNYSTPNAWEIAVPAGTYEINTTWSSGSTDDLTWYSCSIENFPVWNGTARNRAKDPNDINRAQFSRLITVTDGKLTVSGLPRLGFMNWGEYTVDVKYANAYPVTCGGLSQMTITRVSETPIKQKPAWFPASKAPWWQLELNQSQEIGHVVVTNRDRCAQWWLFRGSECNEVQPLDQFYDLAEEGAIVGVSDVPCLGTTCGGTSNSFICGRILKQHTYSFANSIDRNFVEELLNPALKYSVDCAGRTGKYVYVQLPSTSSNRILAPAAIEVFRAKPAPAPEGSLLCYGLQPKAESNIPVFSPQYTTTTDPEDPRFYSTCYLYKPNITFLPLEGTQTETSSRPDSWHFTSRCLDCEMADAVDNLQFWQPPQWKLAPKGQCRDCSAQPPVNQNATSTNLWNRTALNRALNASCPGLAAGSCHKQVVSQDGRAPATADACLRLVDRDPDCQTVAVFRPLPSGRSSGVCWPGCNNYYGACSGGCLGLFEPVDPVSCTCLRKQSCCNATFITTLNLGDAVYVRP